MRTQLYQVPGSLRKQRKARQCVCDVKGRWKCGYETRAFVLPAPIRDRTEGLYIAEVNEDEVLSENSLLLQTEGKANNGEVFGSDEDLLATPVSKTAPQQITDKLPLTATDLSVSAKGQEKADGQPAKQALSQEPKTPDAGKKSKTKVTMSGQAGAEMNLTGGAIKALSVEERAKKFNMPLSDSARLKVRMERFGAVASDAGTAKSEAKGTTKTSRTLISANPPPANLVQLKKRAERFGQSVSTVAKHLEEKERLLKRKQRFANIPDTEVSINRRPSSSRF